MQPTNLIKRLFAEALGTALLIISVVGSGIMATNLTDDVALQLLANAGATVGALIALILMFGPISGAHFNPVVTAATCIFDGRQWRELLPYAV
ncbi:MAG: aquaporin, partial [Ilumatobacteraceae bacterium]